MLISIEVFNLIKIKIQNIKIFSFVAIVMIVNKDANANFYFKNFHQLEVKLLLSVYF